MATKRTLQPKKRKRAKTHGFRARTTDPKKKKIVKSRRAKGRKILSH